MNICLLTGTFPPHTIGGVESYVTEVAKRLEAEGHHAFVVTTEPYDGVASLRPHHTSYEGIDVWRFFPANVAHKSTYERYSLPRQALWRGLDTVNPHAMAMVERVLDRTKPDVVHINGLEGISTLASVAAARSDAASIHTLHGCTLLSPGSTIRVDVSGDETDHGFGNHPVVSGAFARFQRALLAPPDTVIGPSQYVLDAHRKRGFFENVPRWRLQHGVERVADAPSTPPDEPTALYVGRLAPEKGVETLLAAATDLPNVQFHLCGSGPSTEFVERRADAAENLTYHGFVRGEELWSLRRAATVGVVPSVCSEVFGLAISESYGAGLPVVGSAVGGIPELIEPGTTGELCDPGRPESLVEAIRTILDRDQTALRANALAWAKNHTLKAHVESLLKIYDTATDRR